MVDPFTLIGIAGQAGQIATSVLQSKNFLINSEMRAEQLKTSVLSHEQQVKMLHLQQEYKLRDFTIDLKNKFDQETYKSLLKIHEQRSIECKVPPYALGQWLNSTILPTEPAPYIIICTNTYQGDSPFKNEDVIKPLHKVYQSLKEYNSLNNDIITITETRQYFNSDEDVKNFYIRELQCPAIIVYSYFIGSSLVISMLYAGITNKQNIQNIGSNHLSFKRNTIRLWEMDYTLIHNIKLKKKNNLETNGSSENPFQWKKNLDNLIEAFVGIKVQSLIDEYFQNSYTYEPNAVKYLNERKEKYSGLNEWKEFESEILLRDSIINNMRKEFYEKYDKSLPYSDELHIKIAIFGKVNSGKSSLISSILQKNINAAEFDNMHNTYSEPPFDIVEVCLNYQDANNNEIIKISETTNLHIFVIDNEPVKFEIDFFNFIHQLNIQKSTIVYFNKSDKFDLLTKRDVEIIKERTKSKMSKYIKNNEDIIFGCSLLYDKQTDSMIRQDNYSLSKRIHNEILSFDREHKKA